MEPLVIDLAEGQEPWDAFYARVERALLGELRTPAPPGLSGEMLQTLYWAYWADGS